MLLLIGEDTKIVFIWFLNANFVFLWGNKLICIPVLDSYMRIWSMLYFNFVNLLTTKCWSSVIKIVILYLVNNLKIFFMVFFIFLFIFISFKRFKTQNKRLADFGLILILFMNWRIGDRIIVFWEGLRIVMGLVIFVGILIWVLPFFHISFWMVIALFTRVWIITSLFSVFP